MILLVTALSIVGRATRYGLEVRNSNTGGGEIFHARLNRHQSPPKPLYNRYGGFSLAIKLPMLMIE
jgi:hypothetical protein